MRTAILLCFLAIATPALAEVNGGHPGTVYPPPKAGDNSCWARSLRLFPFASQSDRRQIWFEACQTTTEGKRPLGSLLVCRLNDSGDGTSTLVCEHRK